MQKLFLLLCSLSLSMALMAQQSKELYNDSKLTVKGYTSECSDKQNGIFKEKILLEFRNKTNSTITVSYTQNLWYNNKQVSAGNSEMNKTVVLKPNETLKADCATKDQALVIFSKHLDFNGSVLTKYELSNLTITPNER